ncbi:MAG: stage V sporulation protein AE [Clostridia bacterium]|nr:stage V sporulation protein AE [Clostridia bacterium]
MDWKSVGEAVLPYLRAFLIGGGLCVLAQILIDKTKLTPARILVVYVVAGVFLGGVGLYRHLADFGGAGATTPLTGFGYLIAKGVQKAVDEKGLLGALTGPLTAAAGGTAAALVFGYTVALVCKGKPKD